MPAFFPVNGPKLGERHCGPIFGRFPCRDVLDQSNEPSFLRDNLRGEPRQALHFSRVWISTEGDRKPFHPFLADREILLANEPAKLLVVFIVANFRQRGFHDLYADGIRPHLILVELPAMETELPVLPFSRNTPRPHSGLLQAYFCQEGCEL